MSLEKDLEVYAKNGFNVLLRGDRGCGKTQRAKDIFNKVFGKQGEDWLYFSCPTLDPWAKLVGIPDVVENADGTKKLVSVQPENILNKNVKAILIDEFNRGLMETTNALMELLDSKSINGKRLPNLNCIWAAVNINHDNQKTAKYHVEEMDPAQLDRFKCIIDVDNTPSLSYFQKKYGDNGRLAVEWWKELPEEGQKQLSSRRLDWVIEAITAGIKHNHMLPIDISATSLVNKIKSKERVKITVAMLKDSSIPLDAKKKAFEAVLDESFDAENTSELCEAILVACSKEEVISTLDGTLARNKKANRDVRANLKSFMNQLLAASGTDGKKISANINHPSLMRVKKMAIIAYMRRPEDNTFDLLTSDTSISKLDTISRKLFEPLNSFIRPERFKEIMDSELLAKTPVNTLALAYVRNFHAGYKSEKFTVHTTNECEWVNTSWIIEQVRNIESFGDKAAKLCVGIALGIACLLLSIDENTDNQGDRSLLYRTGPARLCYKLLGSQSSSDAIAKSGAYKTDGEITMGELNGYAQNITNKDLRGALRFSPTYPLRTIDVAGEI